MPAALSAFSGTLSVSVLALSLSMPVRHHPSPVLSRVLSGSPLTLPSNLARLLGLSLWRLIRLRFSLSLTFQVQVYLGAPDRAFFARGCGFELLCLLLASPDLDPGFSGRRNFQSFTLARAYQSRAPQDLVITATLLVQIALAASPCCRPLQRPLSLEACPQTHRSCSRCDLLYSCS